MPSDVSGSSAAEVEKRVWNLLTKDFRWQVPADFPVSVLYRKTNSRVRPKLQIFEIAISAIFAKLRPDYRWHVTPNSADGGVDFVGEHEFLRDDLLEIAATVTVGGQCKKRSQVNSVLNELGGSLLNMAVTLKPTFFVVAFAATVSQERIDAAKTAVESQLHRHCHILGRRQVEGLLRDNLDVIERILLKALNADEIEEIRTYLAATRVLHEPTVAISAPERVLAGVPFQVAVEVRDDRLIAQQGRIRLLPSHGVQEIGPLAALTGEGALLDVSSLSGELNLVRYALDLSSYAVGQVDLGTVELRLDDHWFAAALGSVTVVENVRPHYMERPFTSNVQVLRREFDRAGAGGFGVVAVVGSGGSGKSRLCEEFAMDRKRHGVGTVTVSQLNTHDEPHRLFADLLIQLVDGNPSQLCAAEAVIEALAEVDETLSARAAASIRAIFGESGPAQANLLDGDVLSAAVLLLVSQLSRASLIVHLQDLHWCTADVISLLDSLLWQASRVLRARSGLPNQASRGIFFILEGRIREQQSGTDGYDTSAFDTWLRKLNWPTTRVEPLNSEDAREFVVRLFERRFQAQAGHLHQSLFDLQSELIDRIDRAAGGNPFHSLAQVELLRQRGVIGQSRETGQLYLIAPEATGTITLPATVYELIVARWLYLREHLPGVALVLWAAALLDDRLPVALFRLLVHRFAPDVSLTRVYTEGFLEESGNEVTFRHENYFAAVHDLTVAEDDQIAAVEVYADWYGRSTEPADRLRLARSLLVLPEPDTTRALSALKHGLDAARSTGDDRLTRRIAALWLDTLWTSSGSATSSEEFLQFCADELAYTADLLDSDRLDASRRTRELMARIAQRRRESPLGGPAEVRLEKYLMTAETVHLRFLFVDRPAEALERGFALVSRIETATDTSDPAWGELEMEARHALAVALAIAGEIDQAVSTSRQAVALARMNPTPRSLQIIATYANILLARDADQAENLLRELVLEAATADGATRDEISINLGRVMVLKAHRLGELESAGRLAALTEARALLAPVFRRADGLGRHPDAAAAALLLGIGDVIEDRDGALRWFAQAVAAATRGGHRETLWKARLNLASATHRFAPTHRGEISSQVLAALELMENSLSAYAQPEESARFASLRGPFTQAGRLLSAVGDPAGHDLLERYTSLADELPGPPAAAAGSDDGLRTSYEWLMVGDEGYVLY